MTDSARSLNAKQHQRTCGLGELCAVLEPQNAQARRGEVSIQTFEESRKGATQAREQISLTKRP